MHAWTTLNNASLRTGLLTAFNFVSHLKTLTPLLRRAPGTNLDRFVKARPEIIKVALTRYLAANWDVPTRISRIIDHCNIVEEIGRVIDFPPDIVVDLVTLTPIDPRYRITLDQARWLLRDGQLVISLWEDTDRIFSIGFCLAEQDGNGKRIAYIGGIQGRQGIDVLDRYRNFTKLASGMRPRDFLVEVFKLVCREIGVAEIRAVADANYHSRQYIENADANNLSYDEVWRERGGIDGGDGFFILPVKAHRRTEDSIPAKKRTLYRKRYKMMDSIEELLSAVFSP